MTLTKTKAALLVLGCLLLLFYFLFDPSESWFMPQCIFHKVTGLQCMGCGAQRMVHALLHGDFRSAFHANAFLFCSLPFIFFLGWVELNRKRLPRLYAKCHSMAVIITVAILLAVWLVLRNLLSM